MELTKKSWVLEQIAAAIASATLVLGAALKTGYNKILGYTKFDYRPTGGGTNSYAVQVRHNVGSTSGLVSSVDHEAHAVASGTASLRGIQGLACVDATFIATGATYNGLYGQFRADGTFTGSGFGAAVYGIVEASAAITASHICAGWFDTHQINPITGSYQILYLTNNGSLALDEFVFTYGDAAAFINIDAASAVTPAFITGPGTAASGTPLKIKVIYKGTPFYWNLYPTDNA
jgi:hypothetical protein